MDVISLQVVLGVELIQEDQNFIHFRSLRFNLLIRLELKVLNFGLKHS